MRKTRLIVTIIEGDNEFPEQGGQLNLTHEHTLDHGTTNPELPGVISFEFGKLVGAAVQQLEQERGLHPV